MISEISNEVETLIEGCKKGERRHQEKIYKLYSKKMFGVCLRYAKNRMEAEDLLQESFIKVFNKINQFKQEGSFEGWIRKIAVNTCLENLRRISKLYPVVDIEKIEDEPIAENLLSQFAAHDLIKLIQSLPAGFKAVFNLYAIEGYTHKEIGKMLGINENTSKSQLSRARTALQNSLKQTGGYKNEKSL